MTRLEFILRALMIGAALIPAAGTVAAAETTAPTPEPRYAVHGQRLERAASQENADGRFRLDLRLEPVSIAANTGGDFSLQAKLFDAKAAACSVDPDAVFANGFE